MKVIDLLNKIANNEKVPNKIKYKDKIFYLVEFNDGNIGYQTEYGTFSDYYNLEYKNTLNDEVEIIEEPQEHKIPEKIKIDNEDRIQALSTGNYCYKVKQIDKIIIYKINEILDYLEEIE